MNNAIISVENLGKKYRIRHQAERQSYTALRDVIASKAKRLFRSSPLRRERGEGQGEVSKASSEDFWALKDVSFEVKQGEVVGIIGRNGAGKSTLLKILSRITEPTEGRVTLRGRVASLLEVGTGFHPELTGRENIFLNGAILGMSRAEIRKKFDEIVAFAEVEKFLDTPVKRYSSGMYVRLAFAVAAHLEPEILIVDEVLAVGDAQFQKKCLGKITEVAKGGRTVLFVSHNVAALRSLCERGLCLQAGKLVLNDTIGKTVDYYLSAGTAGTERLEFRKRKAPSDRRLFISDFWMEDNLGRRIDQIDPLCEVVLKFQINAIISTNAGVNIRIRSREGYLIWIDSDALQRQQFNFESGISFVSCMLNPLNLTSGSYTIDLLLSIHNQEWIDDFPDACNFIISSLDPYGAGFDLASTFASFHVPHKWVFAPKKT
jgi:lipopolysaccharide transport system ATP-binding protein